MKRTERAKRLLLRFASLVRKYKNPPLQHEYTSCSKGGFLPRCHLFSSYSDYTSELPLLRENPEIPLAQYLTCRVRRGQFGPNPGQCREPNLRLLLSLL